MKKRLLRSAKKKFESSPDELLGIMREIFESTSGSLEECGEAFDVLSACFEELDNHLSAGGDLPTDWKGTR